MRLGMRCRFRQLRTCRRIRPGQLWARIGHTGPFCCVYAEFCSTKSGYVSISVHEDDWNSMRCFAFCGAGNPCALVSPSAPLWSVFTRTYGGCDHATGQASFEAETRNQSRHREGARCRRAGSFADGWCIRIHDARCRYPAILQYLAKSALLSWRRGNGRRQSGHVPSLR
jgi:hypothetical protein